METYMKIICTYDYDKVNIIPTNKSSNSLAEIIYNITKLHHNHIYNND